jgi:hypothetical protein
MRHSRLFAIVSCLLIATAAQAAVFPDVPADYPYKKHIDELVSKNILKGNANGTFAPTEPINRAALVVILYRASNRLPSEPLKSCMNDVVAGVWYEAAVCDALRQKFVSGYEGRGFLPDKPVTRAEAIKMIETIMEFNLTLQSIKDFVPPVLTDVSEGDWFKNYIYHAYAKKILPISGWTGNVLSPNAPLSRGETAALISNALAAKGLLKEDQPQGSSSSAAAGSSSSLTLQERRDQAEKNADERAKEVRLLTVDVPFKDGKTFDQKKPYSYKFTLKQTTTISMTAGITAGSAGSITARLYKIESSGLSNEYYLGFTEGRTAYLLNTLTPGTYQIDLQPTGAESTTFSIEVAAATGDANDGFSQAKSLESSQVRTDMLSANDLQDFYKFTVEPMADGVTKNMTVSVTSTGGLNCIIYGLSNVDFYGEEFPTCGEAFSFPSGNYMIAIIRDSKAVKRAEKATYTIKLTK